MAPPKRIQVNAPNGIQNPVFSQAMIHGGLVYVSGNIGFDYRYPYPPPLIRPPPP
jgi:enamine deaminase RidA (YjgF/YER057c/UK114 family)